jgi:hypothetical protein
MPERPGYQPPGQNAFESMGADIKRAWADLRAQFGSGPAAPVTPTPAESGAAQTVATEVPAPAPALPAVSQPAARTPSFIFGAILVVLGIAFLAANSGIAWTVILPAALIAVGIALLVRNLEKKT